MGYTVDLLGADLRCRSEVDARTASIHAVPNRVSGSR